MIQGPQCCSEPGIDYYVIIHTGATCWGPNINNNNGGNDSNQGFDGLVCPDQDMEAKCKKAQGIAIDQLRASIQSADPGALRGAACLPWPCVYEFAPCGGDKSSNLPGFLESIINQ